MSFHNALYEHMAGKTEITGLTSTRIYQDRAPTSATLPYIVYWQVGNSHSHHLGGDSGLGNPLFQIDCWDNARSGARTLFEALREEMDTFRGTMGTGNDATTVRSTECTGDLDVMVERPGEQGGLFGVTSTWEFWLYETAATP